MSTYRVQEEKSFMIDENIMERYSLCMGRIKDIAAEDIVREPLSFYFKDAAAFLMKINQVLCNSTYGIWEKLSTEEKAKINHDLYKDILPDNYDESFGNPDYITYVFEKASLPAQYAKMLCFLYAELRGMVPYAFEERYDIVTLFAELFVEVYGMFESASRELLTEEVDNITGDITGDIIQEVDGEFEGLIPVPELSELKEVLVSFENDNADIITPDRTLDQLDPERDYAYRIIMDSDLTDTGYLYMYGEYISDNEIRLSEYLAGLDEEVIKKIADTYTEGYRIGFVKAAKPLDKKKTVNIRYPIGFERVVRTAIAGFDKMGLRPVIYRSASIALNKKNHHRIGYTSTSPNKQYDYDHIDDRGLFLDNDFAARQLLLLKTSLEQSKELANVHAGPACIETFGEEPFSPVKKKNAITLDREQEQISSRLLVESANITNKYIIGEERSFTIIAFPTPAIGNDFDGIFKETIALNTLDYKLYEDIQQKLIDALDTADRIHIVGKGGNETDLFVELCKLSDPQSQTKFENCVADVNIPVGEVFTSPVLKGTNGILNVKEVYLEGLLYKNLKVEFKDGIVAGYSCANFAKASDNMRYFKENVLYNHDALPLGEFAIGTNTTAYCMARKYSVEDRLPILIGEKTGPHFALGDTCYSHEEEVKVYNPDGKEIIAKENDFSIKRKEDPIGAYFGCHTDITIPYDELGGIYAITENDEGMHRLAIIEDGRFVLPGTEILNEALKNV